VALYQLSYARLSQRCSAEGPTSSIAVSIQGQVLSISHARGSNSKPPHNIARHQGPHGPAYFRHSLMQLLRHLRGSRRPARTRASKPAACPLHFTPRIPGREEAPQTAQCSNPSIVRKSHLGPIVTFNMCTAATAIDGHPRAGAQPLTALVASKSDGRGQGCNHPCSLRGACDVEMALRSTAFDGGSPERPTTWRWHVSTLASGVPQGLGTRTRLIINAPLSAYAKTAGCSTSGPTCHAVRWSGASPIPKSAAINATTKRLVGIGVPS
jgi:hypothetical protein